MKSGNVVKQNSKDGIVKCLEIRKKKKISANISNIFQQERGDALDYTNMMKHFFRP